MHRTSKRTFTVIVGLLLAGAVLWPRPALAHCDGVDGPVVAAAKQALATGKVEQILIWVQPKDEGEIRRVFQQTLSVRKLGPQARELADRYLFETLVRVHRAGEGAPFTGLKPAGRDLGPAVPAADKALETGSPEQLVKFLNKSVHDGLHGRYVGTLKAKRAARPGDVKAGREYVKAYVDYVHYVERIYLGTKGPAHGHEGAAPAPKGVHDEHGAATPPAGGHRHGAAPAEGHGHEGAAAVVPRGKIVNLVEFPPLRPGKDREFRAWFAWSTKEYAKHKGFLRRYLLQPRAGGNYAAVVEHESYETFMPMHNSPTQKQAHQRVKPLLDGGPTPSFYVVAISVGLGAGSEPGPSVAARARKVCPALA
ncbi:MAG: hypothetical protein HY906_18595 [Deltaproteobacteria bacterium]|nr:hypothetical protein [Deltaproteobacteria bacterium]